MAAEGDSMDEEHPLRIWVWSSGTFHYPEHHGRMKHLDLCLYWLRDKVEHGMINPDFIPTGDIIADCFTKCVPAPKVRFFC
jgi:hypothetical protein